jgi:predicted metal-dependent hydrolase
MAAERFPPAFAAGVQRFNRGEFFEAHEAFEELLDGVEGDGRWDLLVALIQVAVGYHKCVSGHPGAARMLRLGSEKLEAFPPVAWGVDVDALRKRTAADLAAFGTDTPSPEHLRATPPRIEMRRAGLPRAKR